MNKDKLLDIIENHIQWATHGGQTGQQAILHKVDLREADLGGSELSGIDLSESDLSCALISWSSFQNANLKKVNFEQALVYL